MGGIYRPPAKVLALAGAAHVAAPSPGPAVSLPTTFAGVAIHMIGVKGNGMAALAEVLSARGATITGSDVAEHFQTSEMLDHLRVSPQVGFDQPLPAGTDLVVHSTAFQPDSTAQLRSALEAGLPVVSYPQALGALSRRAQTVSITGVHGKSTTTALCACLVDALGLPATVLAGTGMANFDGSGSLNRGERYFVAETCEYQRHFDWLSPDHAVVASVEWEHPDTYASADLVEEAFVAFLSGLGRGGSLIYCADDRGAVAVAKRVAAARDDVRLVPYGEAAEGPFAVRGVVAAAGETRFEIAAGAAVGASPFVLRVPACHNALNATAATAVAAILSEPSATASAHWWARVSSALLEFRGGRRRMEMVGEAAGVAVIDDYGHHPTEIRATLEGLRAFYPGRRLVVDFMSHTYSRTLALLDEFGAAFGEADLVILHRVFASARERDWLRERRQTPDQVAAALVAAVKGRHPACHYSESFPDAVTFLLDRLGPGDVLVTMGAGDNWQVGRGVLQRLDGGAAG